MAEELNCFAPPIRGVFHATQTQAPLTAKRPSTVTL
jgi:hypothetical protein